MNFYMETAISLAIAVLSIGLFALSIAYSYKIVIETNIKKRFLDKNDDTSTTQQTMNVADDLQKRLEQFRQERFSSLSTKQSRIPVSRK